MLPIIKISVSTSLTIPSYYVWPPALLTSKPLLLVSTDQVEQFLQEINGAIDGCYLTLGSEAEEFGLVLKFPSHPGLRPRYLGNSTSREMFSSMERGVPDSEHRPPGESRPSAKPERTTLEDWQYMMGLAFEVSKGKNKAAKAAKKDQRTAKQQQWKDDLKRAERFLGFRPGVLGLPGKTLPFQSANGIADRRTEPAEDASWDDVQAYHAAKAQHNVLQAVNPEALPPYPFDKLPVFVCVDVECYEHDKSKVTEIGVAMLDTADLEGLSPGANGGNWHQKIKARHLRVKEHAHLRNGNFVSDAAEKFEFPEGGSEFVDLADAPRAIATCFREPFCKTDRDEAGLAKSQSQSTEENEIADAEDGGADLPQKEPAVQSSREEAHSDESYPKPPESESPKRTLILVGHDIASDIRYLRRVGYDLGNLSNLHTTLDTASLQRALVHEWNPKSLAGVLYDFDLTGWHQHNAGNDAVYTLWAMVAVVLKSATQRGDESVRKKHEERKVGRVQEAVVRAGTQAIEEGEGWSSGGEEEGPSVQAAKPPAEQKPSEEQRSEDEPAGADDYGGGMKVF